MKKQGWKTGLGLLAVLAAGSVLQGQTWKNYVKGPGTLPGPLA